MSRNIKVSLLFNDELKHVTIPFAGEPSVVHVIAATLNLTKTQKGAIKVSSADFVVFDMDGAGTA